MAWQGRRRRRGPAPEQSPTTNLQVISRKAYPDWEAIYQDNVDWIYRLMFTKVGNNADAEDLTAEVFTAALRPMRATASIGEVRAYLRVTARTVLATHWRTTMGREITVIEDDVPAPIEDGEISSDAPARALTVLSELPERHRRILELRFLEGCSIKESAVRMRISVANAKVLQHRALRMAAQLAEEDDDERT